MKLVIFSDNHRDIDVVRWIVQHNQNADRIISLGDSELKEHELSNLGVFGVRGNYPFEPDFPYDLIMEFEDIRFLMTHGHKHFVKSGLYNITCALESNKCDVALFGHTHQALIKKEENYYFLNPGSTTHPKMGLEKSYMIIHIDHRYLDIELREVYTDKLIKKHLDHLMPRREVYGF